MRDVRYTALKKAIEARWPGCRVVWEAYFSPDDHLIEGWVRILHVRERDRHTVDDFANDLKRSLFPGPSRFFISAVMREDERATLRRLGLPARRTRDRRPPVREASRGSRPRRRGDRARTRA